MSNWDLMMPGMGLTAIGLAGVVVSYSGIAHTFIDGMHALTGLTMFIGLIFLSAGILEGGVSTSNRAKATTLVILSISLAFGSFALLFNTVSSTNTFAGVMMILVAPAVVIAYVAMKMPQYVKPVGSIFALAAGAGIATFVGFGLVGPSPYLVDQTVAEDAAEEIHDAAPTGPTYSISILEGSAEQGMPDYEPDVANVPQGYVIEWVNDDSVAHTATSSLDFGETFDSGLMDGGEVFTLDTADLPLGEIEYMCVVHPWMIATIVIEEPKEPVIETVVMPEGSGIQQPGQIYYDPEVITVAVGTTIVWENADSMIHTVTDKAGAFDSEMISAGESYEHMFNEPGTFDYFCIVHPWMEGTVTVE